MGVCVTPWGGPGRERMRGWGDEVGMDEEEREGGEGEGRW